MSDSDVSKQIQSLIENFNKYSLILSEFLIHVSNKTTFIIYNNFINQAVSTQPIKLIDSFVISVLKYESKIMDDDEKFFLNKDYDDDVKGDKEDIRCIVEIKNIWSVLDSDNKAQIKSYIKLLCRISRKYFNLIDKSRNEELNA